MTYLREIVWNVKGIAFLLSVTRLVLSEPSIIAYRYISSRFSAWIRILSKKWSNLIGSRLDSHRGRNSSAAKIHAALTSLIPMDRDLQIPKGSIRPLRKKGLALRKDGALVTTSENRWELRGVTCPFAVDQLLLWDQALSACFPLSAFLATLQRVGLWSIHDSIRESVRKRCLIRIRDLAFR